MNAKLATEPTITFPLAACSCTYTFNTAITHFQCSDYAHSFCLHIPSVYWGKPGDLGGRRKSEVPAAAQSALAANVVKSTQDMNSYFNTYFRMQNQPRHAGHNHTINIKYGYIVLGLSLVYVSTAAFSRYLYLKNWKSHARPSSTSVWSKVGRVPLLWHVLLWCTIVLALGFFNVSNYAENYTVVIKRFGRLGYSLVPLDVFLVLRPLLLQNSYLDQVPLHKWLLRLILAAGVIHGGGFFVKWVVEGFFWEKLLRGANFLGVVVATASVVLSVVSLRPVRRRIYALFYLWHNLTVFLFLVLIFFHARPGVADFSVLVLVMIVYQVYERYATTSKIARISIVDKETASLRVVRLSKPASFPSWLPGSHIRLSYGATNYRTWLFPSHPYTVCSFPEDSTLDLVVKKTPRFQIISSLDYTVSTPFASLPLPFFSSAENVNIICGGSGISLGVPIFRYFKRNPSAQTNLYWCVSNKNDTYVLGELGVEHAVDVYVTGNDVAFLGEGHDEEDYGLLDENEGVELESLTSDQSNPFSDIQTQNARKLVNCHKGRPILNEVFSLFENTDDPANKWLVVCGPESLVSDVKKWGLEHKVQVFSELYDM